jgi:hypothetical protein
VSAAKVNRANLLAELRAATRKVRMPKPKRPSQREAAQTVLSVLACWPTTYAELREFADHWPAALLRETIERLQADGAIEGFGKVGKLRITSAGAKRQRAENKASSRAWRASVAKQPKPHPVKHAKYETCLGCGGGDKGVPVQFKTVLRARAVDALVWLTLEAGDDWRVPKGQWLNVDEHAIVASAIELFARGLG